MSLFSISIKTNTSIFSWIFFCVCYPWVCTIHMDTDMFSMYAKRSMQQYHFISFHFVFNFTNGLINYQNANKQNQQYTIHSLHFRFIIVHWAHHFSTLFVFHNVIEMAHLPYRSRCTVYTTNSSR